MRFGVPLGSANSSFFLSSSHSLPYRGLHQDNGEFAFELVAVQPELEIAALDLRFGWKVAEQLERARSHNITLPAP